jgi:hypothetical protein
MNTKTTAVLALVAGFIGGAMSHYLFVPAAVRAQGPVQSSTEIRAQKFVLVDENGTSRGVFGFRSDGSPDLQVTFGKPNGQSKILEARWNYLLRQNRLAIADLKPTNLPKGH